MNKLTDVRKFTIPSRNFLRLQAEIKKLNKRAEKLGTEPVVLTVLESKTETQTDPIFGFEYQEVYHVCTVEGESPKLGGWTLVAAIEPVPNGENLVREIPGEGCPKRYRKASMGCDHCRTNVKRNKVYVLRHSAGDHKQVGSSCIADFLGHESPESMLGRAEYMMSCEGLVSDATEEDWGGGGGGGKRVVPLTQFVAVCAVVIRKLGWLPRSQAHEMEQATADIAWGLCVRHDQDNREFVKRNGLEATDADLKLAKDAIAWAAAITDAGNNYLHNIGVCCRQECVEFDQAGWTGSVVPAYQKSLVNGRPRVDSQYVGVVGDRCEFADLTIVGITPMEANDYGPRNLVTLTDPNGNVLKWFTGVPPKWVQQGEKVSLKAKVIKHSDFRGQSQTKINRPKVVED